MANISSIKKMKWREKKNTHKRDEQCEKWKRVEAQHTHTQTTIDTTIDVL